MFLNWRGCCGFCVCVFELAFVFCTYGPPYKNSQKLFQATLIKHGARLYLKFEGLNLSIVIIFKTFHWLKNNESYSVASVPLCVSLLHASEK